MNPGMGPCSRACRGNYEHTVRCCRESALPTIPPADISAHAAWHRREAELRARKTAAVKCVPLSVVDDRCCHMMMLP